MELLFKKVWLIVFLVVLIGGCLSKPKSRVGDFNVKVIDALTGEGISYVDIFIDNNQYETDLNGRFSLISLEPGVYQIRMSREWYESKEVAYKHIGKPKSVIFHLRPKSLPGRIYYSFDEGQNKEIYELILENRTVNKVLSLTESGETNPAWSASGKLAVESTAIEKISNVYNINMGSPIRSNSILGEHPSLDSSGKLMVLKADGKIRKYNLNNNMLIETYGQAGWRPVINPDGTMVAYVSGNYTKLYFYSNESEFNEFTPDGGYKVNNPCWSPDGKKVVFEAYKESKGQRGLFWIQVTPTLSKKMKKITLHLGPTEQHKHPTWNDLGDIIYFSRSATYSSRRDIYGVRFKEDQPEQGIDQWIMVSKGSGSKDYPCWGR
jgi:hypothetical protein